jgi:hypothetical protein
MKFSCILNCKEGKCKQWPCNSHRERLKIQSEYGGNSIWQRNPRKINKRKEKLGLLYSRQQAETYTSHNPKTPNNVQSLKNVH